MVQFHLALISACSILLFISSCSILLLLAHVQSCYTLAHVHSCSYQRVVQSCLCHCEHTTHHTLCGVILHSPTFAWASVPATTAGLYTVACHNSRPSVFSLQSSMPCYVPPLHYAPLSIAFAERASICHLFFILCSRFNYLACRRLTFVAPLRVSERNAVGRNTYMSTHCNSASAERTSLRIFVIRDGAPL